MIRKVESSVLHVSQSRNDEFDSGSMYCDI